MSADTKTDWKSSPRNPNEGLPQLAKLNRPEIFCYALQLRLFYIIVCFNFVLLLKGVMWQPTSSGTLPAKDKMAGRREIGEKISAKFIQTSQNLLQDKMKQPQGSTSQMKLMIVVVA